MGGLPESLPESELRTGPMAVDKNKIIAEATKLVQKGAHDKAIQAYQKILAEDPKDVRVLLKVAELQQKKGEARAAAEAFDRVAQTYAEQGFFLKAVAVYKQIVKLAPDDVRVNERLAGLYQQLGLMSDAMSQYQHMASAYERAGDGAKLTEVLKQMLELDPENIASSIKLGELYARANQAGPALECFRRAAEYLKRHNRADEYLKVAERIAALSPGELGLTRELANIYLAKGDTKRALAKLQLCFKADPKDVDTLTLLARAFRELGQTSKTISVYKELARVHEERGRNGEAASTWRKVQELAPDDEDAAVALGGASAGPVPFAAPQPAPAPSPASAPGGRRAPAAGPPPGAGRPAPAPAPAPGVPFATPAAQPAAAGGDIAKILTETDVYVKYGLHDKALDHLKRAVALDPQCADAHEKAREIHVSAGRPADAARSGALAVRAFVARGQLDLARDAVSRLRQIAPDFPELMELNAAVGGTEEVDLVGGELEEEQVVLSSGDVSEEPASGDDDALALAAATGPGPGEDEEVVEDDVAPPPARGRARPVAELPDEPLGGPSAGAEAREGLSSGAEAREGLSSGAEAREGDDGLAATAVLSAGDEVEEERPAPSAPRAPARAAPPPRRAPAAAPPLASAPGKRPPPRAAAPSLASAPGGRRPAPPPEPDEVAADLSDEIEEADFFVQQGLLDDAREALQNLLAFYPDHPQVRAKLADLDRKAAPAPARDGAPATADESFDIARELAELGGGTGPVSADDGFQYSVEDVFAQFKKGVEQTVKREDSATHYDLGIAYKEMGLLDDAIHEFEVALDGNDRKREVDCLSMVGLCRAEKGDAAGAVEAFRRALASDHLTKDAAKAIHFDLAVAHEATGDREAALYYFQRAAKADPAFRDAAGRAAALGGGPGRAPLEEARGPVRRSGGEGGPVLRSGGEGGRPPAGAARATGAPPRPSPAAKKNIGYL